MKIGVEVFAIFSLLCCCMAYSDVGTVEVVEGSSFTVEKEIAIPEPAYPALKLYGETLLFSRPLPWPYHLEKWELLENKVVVQGRLLSSGKYEIPLGVFWWNGKAYALPHFLCASSPVKVPQLTPADLLLPFPEQALVPTVQNVRLENECLLRNQEEGVHAQQLRDVWRHVFLMACLVLVCTPCALQLWRWWQLRRMPQGKAIVVTPGMAFREVKEHQPERPWPKLVYVLNLVASPEKPSLTSYELKQRFSAAGEMGLAEASALIENYSYRPEGDQYFDQTVALVEKRLYK